jgi:hypothetical protein
MGAHGQYPPRLNGRLERLAYVCQTERAYLLSFSEKREDLAEAATIYEQIAGQTVRANAPAVQ